MPELRPVLLLMMQQPPSRPVKAEQLHVWRLVRGVDGPTACCHRKGPLLSGELELWLEACVVALLQRRFALLLLRPNELEAWVGTGDAVASQQQRLPLLSGELQVQVQVGNWMGVRRHDG